MCITPKMPSMPSAEDQAKQQLEIQRQLQADADKRAAGELADERKRAAVAQRRSRRGRRGRTSLITQRTGGLLGYEVPEGTQAGTLMPIGVGFQTLSNQ
tara:strand:- start:331 stop:627 length:297 start_codon:yes stop_codon:yes gene_type:complete